MTLSFLQFIDLPQHQLGGFDHADVHLRSGRVYVAHTVTGSVEVLDGDRSKHVSTIRRCPEASGVICAQDDNLIFAAARGTGYILVIDALTARVLKTLKAGSRPNGIAWDSRHKQLLAADVGDFNVRLVDLSSEKLVTSLKLSGRPRWCKYSDKLDLFLVNVHGPSGLVMLAPENLTEKSFVAISVVGAHGLDIDEENNLAFVACDGGAVVVLDVIARREKAAVPIGGEPDVIWYNRDKHLLYCAIGRPGLIEVIDTKELVVNERVMTEEGAHTLTFDEKRQKLYAFLPKSCRAAVYGEI